MTLCCLHPGTGLQLYSLRDGGTSVLLPSLTVATKAIINWSAQAQLFWLSKAVGAPLLMFA